ncbi:aldehyde dehydrogenase family protein [Tissierella praeacuta]|uniref:aldehyde dehydrogenase family protein n=1 Tax=Tissierella praeacuta TaxID=43131 RepID=UPI000EB836F2|nr:aldehyde dehydrogenase family protein [Tissierella praeacuta]TCU74049.1 aldehyde dehydrogenase (NAD+)/betaine-aldehyde dehydrogenase [Tissierella praeacuta]HAE92711.1 aldehyde dehydrogenase family protein [Tissierella sp.]
MNFQKIYINGEWVESEGGQFIDVENPSDKSIIAKVPRANKEDVNKAVNSARQAFETWQFSTVEERINLMEKVVQGMNENIEYMSETVVKELGCGYKFSKETHIEAYVREAENYIKIAKRYEFERKLEKSIIRREPVGVIGCLTPWNFPLEQIVKKVIPALLAGNCVVLKPSQTTPLTAYILTDIIDKAGFPKGVFNLVSGRGGEVGNALASHKGVDMISFTGSTDGGREVSRLAAEGIKKVVLELGGKSAAIVLKGGDYKLAVKSTLDTVYLNTGQTCNAFTRLLVPEDDLSEIEEMIIEETKNYKFGNPSDRTVDVGPLASEKQFNKVKKYIEIGLEEGARKLIGEIPENCHEGYYMGPTVFTNVSNDMVIAQEEVFGPVLCVIPYRTEEEAIEIANDSIYGLAGAVFGPVDKANKVARKIRTGSIYVNEGEWDLNAPFGGYKYSGIGREGGIEGFEEFLEIKTIYC